MAASKPAPIADARRSLQNKMRQWHRQRHIERRAAVHLCRGIAVWAVLVTPAVWLLRSDEALAVGLTVLFAPGPLFAWYSWQLARAQTDHDGS